LVKAGEHCSLQVLFENLNLALVRDVLMGAYHGAGPDRPPFNSLGLFRFKLLMALKGYGSQRALERDVRVDEGLGALRLRRDPRPLHYHKV
jgi:hypothetical protein